MTTPVIHVPDEAMTLDVHALRTRQGRAEVHVDQADGQVLIVPINEHGVAGEVMVATHGQCGCP